MSFFVRTLKFSFSNNCDVNLHTYTHARAHVTMFKTLKEKYVVITYATT